MFRLIPQTPALMMVTILLMSVTRASVPTESQESSAEMGTKDSPWWTTYREKFFPTYKEIIGSDNNQQNLKEEAGDSSIMQTNLGFSRPLIDIDELEKKFEERHKVAQDKLQQIKSKLSQTVSQNKVSNDKIEKKVRWRPESTPNLNHDLNQKVPLHKIKSEEENTMMGHVERSNGLYQYIGGSKFSNWGGVGTPDSTKQKVNFGPSLPENYFLPSPFLHEVHRIQQTQEGIFNHQLDNNREPTLKSQISNILVEKLKETYYNKESKRLLIDLLNLLREEQYYSPKDSVGDYDKVDIVIGKVPTSSKVIKNRTHKPFSLPRDSFKNRVRPERQFDVSNIRMSSTSARPGQQRSGIDFGEITTDSNPEILASDEEVFDSLSSFYPQSSNWPKSEEKIFGDLTTSRPSVLTSKPAVKPTENGNIEPLGTLFTQLKDTLETFKKKESKNRKKITNLLNQRNIYEGSSGPMDPEVIYVNIWNNVNGELQLAERKHMSREKFDEIESTKDFSQLIDMNKDKNVPYTSPTQKSQFSVQGVGSDQVSPLPTFFSKKHDTRRPISFPQALLNSKLNPSSSFLRITTEQPHSTTFRAKYGLKAPGLLEDIFREKAPPTIPDQTTRSPFKSLIRVPTALNMLGDIPVNANIRRKPSKIPFKENILSIEVPPTILEYEKGIKGKTDTTQKSIQEELVKLRDENSILNSLIRKLIIEEVEITTLPQKSNTNENVEILVEAVKQNPSILTRIQGLRNLHSSAN